MRSHKQQPTRLPRPWDSPCKNTGVGCHFLLQCMRVKSESEVSQSCPTLRNHVDCSPPGSSIHGIFQAGGLEWGAIAFSNLMLRSSDFNPLSAYSQSSFALFEFILLTEAMLRILKGKSNNVIFLLLTPNCLPITFKVQTP